ncbi:MAG: hypothetical protein LUI02_06275 [Clostridiales bacterium]|nr:hypothetical protein [Clostridiales bacterium]
MKEEILAVTAPGEEAKPRRSAKDGVFRDLFSIKKYLLQLYEALHPEDAEATEDDLEYVTLQQILVSGIYNDLGFLVGNRLLILVEAQSTWTANIIVRALIYIARTYQQLLVSQKRRLFSETRVELPEPELYVVYTGDKPASIPSEISLSEEFFGGKRTALDVRVKVFRGGGDDILSQYVVFARVLTEQVKLHGRTRKAVEETLRICGDGNVLEEYLGDRRKEVIDMLETIFDQETETQLFGEEMREEGRQEGKRQAQIEMILSLHEDNYPTCLIARAAHMPEPEVEEIIARMSD